MIITRIQGGLGNQMFQYALAKSCAIERGDFFYLDISDYETYFRPFHLNQFKIENRIAEKELCNKIRNPSFPQKLKKKFFRILHYNRVKNPDTGFTYVTENKINKYDAKIQKINSNIYLDGYWSSEKYFLNIRNELLSDFTLKTKIVGKNEEILQQIKSTNSISIHVRRGDYLKLQHIYFILNTSYYRSAIKHLSLCIPNPYYYIFSNDFDWVRENLCIDEKRMKLVDTNDENTGYLDLELMKNCKHNIIANSSFSWWAAWLNTNPSKIVIRPSKMFINATYWEKDLFPDSWIAL